MMWIARLALSLMFAVSVYGGVRYGSPLDWATAAFIVLMALTQDWRTVDDGY